MLILARLRAGAIGIGLFTVCGCAQHASQSAATSFEQPQNISQPQSQSPTVRAYIDPNTGELRDPTPAELAAEAAVEAERKKAAAANPQSEQPTSRETITPNGAVEVTLDPSAQHPFRACIDKKGDLKMDEECKREAQGAKR